MKTKFTSLALSLAGISLASATTFIRVDFNPVSPTGFSPLAAVFHDGSFDSFDGGDNLSGTGLETLAETGDASGFVAGAPTSANTGVGSGNIGAGGSDSFIVEVADGNTQLNFASMVLFSSDWFIGNQNGQALDVSGLLGGAIGTNLVFDITTVYDAGTETEDFTGVGGSGLFPFSTSGSLGVDITDGSVSVLDRSTNPYLDFTNTQNLDLAGFDPASLDAFTAASLGSITFTVVPEPSISLLGGLAGLTLLRRRRK